MEVKVIPDPLSPPPFSESATDLSVGRAAVGQSGGAAIAIEVAQQETPFNATRGIPPVEAQELARDRVDGLFHLSNLDHPAQVALRQLCINRLAKKLRNGA